MIPSYDGIQFKEAIMTVTTMFMTMLPGMFRTIAIFVLTLVFALPLGMVIMLMRQSRLKITSSLTKIFIAIMRGTPLMLQLLVWYFGPYYLFGMPIGGYRFTAIILGFSLNYAAYFSEIYRAGLEAIPIGQYEAADVLGYSRNQTFFKIILPQLIKTILPAMTNEVITLVKDTSLAFALAYSEVFSIAKQISSSQTSFIPFVISGLFYFIANCAVAFGMERIEQMFKYYD